MSALPIARCVFSNLVYFPYNQTLFACIFSILMLKKYFTNHTHARIILDVRVGVRFACIFSILVLKKYSTKHTHARIILDIRVGVRVGMTCRNDVFGDRFFVCRMVVKPS